MLYSPFINTIRDLVMYCYCYEEKVQRPIGKIVMKTT